MFDQMLDNMFVLPPDVSVLEKIVRDHGLIISDQAKDGHVNAVDAGAPDYYYSYRYYPYSYGYGPQEALELGPKEDSSVLTTTHSSDMDDSEKL
jgi:hypothetical protein